MAELNTLRFTPEDIEAVIQQESGGRPDVLGPVQADGQRAEGLMQINPATAANPGFGLPSIDPATLKDPKVKRAVGTRYLNKMLDIFGDKKTALLAYNHGPGAVQKLLDAGRPLTELPNFKYADEVLARVRQPRAPTALSTLSAGLDVSALKPLDTSALRPLDTSSLRPLDAPPAGSDPRIAQAAADPFSPAAMERDAGRGSSVSKPRRHRYHDFGSGSVAEG